MITVDELIAKMKELDKLKMTIVAREETAQPVQQYVDEHMLGGLVKVITNEHCPRDKVYIISPVDPEKVSPDDPDLVRAVRIDLP